MPLPRILLLSGDPAGIGPELIAKLLTNSHRQVLACCRPLLLTDRRLVAQGAAQAGLPVPPLTPYPDPEAVPFREAEVAFCDSGDAPDCQPGTASAAGGRMVLGQLATALDLLLAGRADALVYAPLNKQAMHLAGSQHSDELRLLAAWLAGKSGWAGNCGEINYAKGVWTTRVTSHIALREVADSITTAGVFNAVQLADRTMRQAGLEQPRIGVAALNPHGGEGGAFGDEEERVIRPAVAQACQAGIDARGPYPADTIFRRVHRELDAVVTMYHDQGQIAMKLMGFDGGVTVSGGLPYPITTPCHGTAFDIVGSRRADAGPLLAALRLAVRLAGGTGTAPPSLRRSVR